MRYFVKNTIRVLLVIICIVIVDKIVCYKTYYIPGLKLFVHWTNIKMDKNKCEDIGVSGPLRYLRFNYFSNHLLGARFNNSTKSKKDWFAMPADEMGTEYAINKNTREVYLNAREDGYCNGWFVVIAYHTNKLSVKEDASVKRSEIVDRFIVDGVKEPYIVLINEHRLIAGHLFARPEKAMHKAHLWHLLL